MLRVLIAVLLTSAPAATPARAQDSVTAFVNVAVIPMDRERVLTGQTVVIQGNRITDIGPVGRVRVPDKAVRVDGQGKFLIPGLADMHVHLDGASTDVQIEHTLFLLLANGVTTVRNMFGNPRTLALRERVAKGELLGPRIYTAGLRIGGSAQPKSIMKNVAAQKAAGYDFIKTGGVPREALDSLAAAAHRVGIPFSGHVLDRGVGLEQALQARYASIEHLEPYWESLWPAGVARKVQELKPSSVSSQDPQLMLELLAQLDESKIPAVAEATKQAGVWNCPTLAVREHLAFTKSQLLQQPGARYVPTSHLERSKDIPLQFPFEEPLTPQQVEVLAKAAALQAKLVAALHRAGAGLLLGTDAQAIGRFAAPYTFPLPLPGFSIHRELELFVAAGLTPYQALETGTRSVAAFFGTLDQTGTIAVGKRADLVLLSGNPLTDIRKTVQPAGVMVNGRWLSRQALDKGLAEIEKASR
jgi:imidazolonepropionase-like amidohydrolase